MGELRPPPEGSLNKSRVDNEPCSHNTPDSTESANGEQKTTIPAENEEVTRRDNEINTYELRGGVTTPLEGSLTDQSRVEAESHSRNMDDSTGLNDGEQPVAVSTGNETIRQDSDLNTYKLRGGVTTPPEGSFTHQSCVELNPCSYDTNDSPDLTNGEWLVAIPKRSSEVTEQDKDLNAYKLRGGVTTPLEGSPIRHSCINLAPFSNDDTELTEGEQHTVPSIEDWNSLWLLDEIAEKNPLHPGTEQPDVLKSFKPSVLTRKTDPCSAERIAAIRAEVTIGSDLTPAQAEEVWQTISEYADCFALSMSEVIPVEGAAHRLDIPDRKSVV